MLKGGVMAESSYDSVCVCVCLCVARARIVTIDLEQVYFWPH